MYDDKAKIDRNQMKMKYSRRLRRRRKKRGGGEMELRKRKKRRSAVGWVDGLTWWRDQRQTPVRYNNICRDYMKIIQVLALVLVVNQ